jgi:hypothetical protein
MVVDPPSYAASSALVPALPASGVEESKGDDCLGIINPAAFDARGSDALLLRFLLSRIRELPLVADCVNTVTGGSWMWCHYPLVCAIYGMAHPHKYTWRRIFGVKLWDTVVDAYERTYPRSSRPAVAWGSATLADDLRHLLQAPSTRTTALFQSFMRMASSTGIRVLLPQMISKGEVVIRL